MLLLALQLIMLWIKFKFLALAWKAVCNLAPGLPLWILFLPLSPAQPDSSHVSTPLFFKFRHRSIQGLMLAWDSWISLGSLLLVIQVLAKLLPSQPDLPCDLYLMKPVSFPNHPSLHSISSSIIVLLLWETILIIYLFWVYCFFFLKLTYVLLLFLTTLLEYNCFTMVC